MGILKVMANVFSENLKKRQMLSNIMITSSGLKACRCMYSRRFTLYYKGLLQDAVRAR